MRILNPENKPQNENVSYHDWFVQAYPEYIINKKTHKTERYPVKEVTFQVTDACNLCCFPAGTKVVMADFTKKNIEDIQVGDKILGFPEHKEKQKQAKLNPSVVTHTYFRHDKILKIKTDDGGEITCTANHPFLVRNAWVEAKHLSIGSMLYRYFPEDVSLCGVRDIALGYRTAITSIETIDDVMPVYNIETECHTYLAEGYFVHNCTYCYQINKGCRKMSFDTAKKLIDNLFSEQSSIDEYLGYPAAVVLDFIGGEPFLEVDLIDKIIDYFMEEAIAKGSLWIDTFMVSICSNGVLYRAPKVQRFIEKHAHHLSITITVDGIKELHDACRVFPDGKGSYDLAHDAAMDLRAHGTKLQSKITLAPDNIQYFSDCMKQMVLDGYYELNANPVFENVWLSETDEKYKYPALLYQEAKKFSDWFINKGYDPREFSGNFFTTECGHPLPETENQNWCGGTGDMLAMDPDGKLYPCIRYMESSVGTAVPPMIIGDVDHGIAVTKEQHDCVHCLNAITRRSQTTDECFYCPVASMCSHCSAFNYQTFGTANKKATYICEIHKAISLVNVYFWNHFYRLHQDIKPRVFDLWVPRQWAEPIIEKKEYSDLVKLVNNLGGYVNEDKTMIYKISKGEKDE